MKAPPYISEINRDRELMIKTSKTKLLRIIKQIKWLELKSSHFNRYVMGRHHKSHLILIYNLKFETRYGIVTRGVYWELK